MAQPSPRLLRIAEKLTILNDHGNVLLARIYRTKKEFSVLENRPDFLREKTFESLLKSLSKKFPAVEAKPQSASTVAHRKNDVIAFLQPFYLLMHDIMEFKDSVTEILTTFDVQKIVLDINVNFDLTRHYLDLVVTLYSILHIVSKVDDRKAYLGLFNLAYEMQQGAGHQSYPRLGQLVVDYENPLRKLHEDFVPHAGTVTLAIKSIHKIFRRKLTASNEILSQQIMFILSESKRLVDPESGATMRCETLPVEKLEKWIVICLAICHQQLQLSDAAPELQNLWQQVLKSSFVLALYRDEVIHIHSLLQAYFDQFRGYSKRVSEIKEWYAEALKDAPILHRDRRRCFRIILKEMSLVLNDQPGLLGPKCGTVLTALNCASYEVEWLIRHATNAPKGAHKQLHSSTGGGEEVLMDRQLPELLFYIEELRQLLRTYAHLIQRYSAAFLQNYYGLACANSSKPLQVMTEDDICEITVSLLQIMQSISAQQIDAGQTPDLRGFRLDWFRVQASTSSVRQKDQATVQCFRYFNGAVFYSELVDNLEIVIRNSADLSVYGVYPSQLEQQFNLCLQNANQMRYAITYAQVTAHFTNRCHALCPDDNAELSEMGLKIATGLLRRITEEAIKLIQALIDELCTLDDQCLPKTAVPRALQVLGSKIKNSNKTVMSGTETIKAGKGNMTSASSQMEHHMPGFESTRRNRTDLTKLDRLHFAVSDLLSSLSHCPIIAFYQHKFVPVEFFQSELELHLHRWLVQLTMFRSERDGMEIAKPSELLHCLKSLITTVASLDAYINVDIVRILLAILPCQSQLENGNVGGMTITSNYIEWYVEAFLRRVQSGQQIVYSPLRRAFVGLSSGAGAAGSGGIMGDQGSSNGGLTPTFSADEFADFNELRALADIIGPLGVSAMSDRINQHIASHTLQLLKLIAENSTTLDRIRVSFRQPGRMKELCKQLTGQEEAVSRLRTIGVFYAFRLLLQDALASILDRRMPYLMETIRNFRDTVPGGQEAIDVSELSVAGGLNCRIDASLVRSLIAHGIDASEDKYKLSCLLMVYIAVSIPYFAKMSDGPAYRPNLDAYRQNSHCAIMAVGLLLAALFSIHGRGKEDTEERAKELLALSSNVTLLAFPDLYSHDSNAQHRSRDVTLALLELLTYSCDYLSVDLLESCCPYVLIHRAHALLIPPNNTTVSSGGGVANAQ